MAPNVVITGAAGFLGAHLCAAFAQAGWSVTAAVRTAAGGGRLDRIAPDVPRLVIDLETGLDALAEALREARPDVVVNAAAYGVQYGQQDLERAVAVNVGAAGRLVAAAARAGASGLIQIGTAYEYGAHAGGITEEAALRPVGLYGATKAGGSLLALQRGAATGLAVSILRPFTLYGPTEPEGKFTSAVALACRTGTPVDLTGGEQLRDVLHVADAAAACVRLAAAGPPAGSVFNLGSDEAMSLRDLGTRIANLAGRDPACLRWGARPYRPDEVMSLVCQSDKFRAAFDWRPRISLADGMRMLLASLMPAAPAGSSPGMG